MALPVLHRPGEGEGPDRIHRAGELRGADDRGECGSATPDSPAEVTSQLRGLQCQLSPALLSGET